MSEVKPPPEFRLVLPRVRLAMPSLYQPFKAVAGAGDGKFNAKGLIAPTDSIVATINAMIAKVAKAKWGVKADATVKALKAADKLFLHDGDAKSEWEGFEGMLYISASSKKPPKVRDGSGQPASEQSGIVYSGCFAKLWLDIWAQDNQFGKRINAELKAVQFAGRGDAFSGGGAPIGDDEFDEIVAPDESAAEDDLAN